MSIPSCVFVLFSNTTGNINTTANRILLLSISSLLPLVLRVVLQTTMSLGILSYRHQKWFCSELPLHPKQQSLSGDKEVCAETFGHWMPLLIQQRSTDNRGIFRKSMSLLCLRRSFYFSTSKIILWLAEKSIYP